MEMTIPEPGHHPEHHSASVTPEALTNRILETLLLSAGRFVSGSELSEAAGVTRAAVWKHIRCLEELGFRVESRRGCGYRLAETPDLLLQPLLSARLRPEGSLGRRVYWFRRLASTNTFAAQLADAGEPHGTLVTALEQTGGKGRQGRSWFAPAGGLWWSLLLRQPFPLARAAELTLVAAVAVRRAILSQAEIPVRIKWPNDLVCGGRKLCGILAEVRAEGEWVQQAVLGIGLNTNIAPDQFPPELAALATSILGESGRLVSHLALVADVIRHLEPLCDALAAGGPAFSAVREEWREACSTLGQRVKIRTGNRLYEGVAVDVDNLGVLHLHLDDGSAVRIHSGEVLFG